MHSHKGAVGLLFVSFAIGVVYLGLLSSSSSGVGITGAVVSLGGGGSDFGVSSSSVSSCSTISSSVEFSSDIYATGNCFTVSSSDIVIDGNGHALYGNGSGIAFILGSYNNVTLMNFSSIQDFAYGASASDVGNQLELVDVFNYDVIYGDIEFI